jgi:GWxTD domain-containing protein
MGGYRGRQWLMAAVVTCGLLAPLVLEAGKQTTDSATLAAKERKEREQKLFRELSPTYQRWLSQDVVYIIAPEERHTFLQLASDPEREQFIVQFWVRRNPDPDSLENAFKKEHYWRILFANGNFASSVPGWKTDRGRIYIIWGPPDEIETRPADGKCPGGPEPDGTASTERPWDTWRYRRLDGIGENIELDFVYWKDAEKDSAMGDYVLAMDPCDPGGSRVLPGIGLMGIELRQKDR